MEDTNNKCRRTNKFLIAIIIVLIIIIILLLFKGCSKSDGNIIHEGKTNIFEIKCEISCDCNCEKCDDNNKTDKVNSTIDDSIKLDIEVLDNDKKWQEKTNLNIFGDSSYVVKDKIAPESTGTYHFMIKNSTSYNVKYDVGFEETNSYNVNMKYKLKKNKEYIISDWVSYSELLQEKIRLNSNSTDTYDLEWRWLSSSNDNSIGENINSKYGLSINIRAVQAND